MENNLSKKAKLIIGIIFSVLIIAAVIGGSIAIANVVKKSKQKTKYNKIFYGFWR